MNEAFKALMEEKSEMDDRHERERASFQKAFEDELQAAFKVKFPKARKFSVPLSWKKNNEEHKAIYAKNDGKYKEMLGAQRAERDEIDARLKEAASKEEIVVSEGMVLYDSVDSGAYRSQGFGEHKYAKADAEDRADKARAYGLKVEIREKVLAEGRDVSGYQYRLVEYQVWASTDEVGARILRLKPEKQTMSEWVRKCDARGVCARVFFPFMTYEQEEKFRKAGA